MFAPHPAPGHSCLPGKNLCAGLGPWFFDYSPENMATGGLTLMISRVRVHGLCGTVANRGIVVNQWLYPPPLPPQKQTPPRGSLKEIHLDILEVAERGFGSNLPAFRCWLRSFALGQRQSRAHPPLLDATKNTENSLDSHQSLRDNRGLDLDWRIWFRQQTGTS